MAAGGVGGSGAQGLAGGLAQLVDDPGVAFGMGLHEVPGCCGGAESGVDDGPGGLAVQGDTHGIGDGAVDGGGDQRVDEFEGVGAGEDAGVAQPVGGVGGRFAAEARDGGGEGGRDFGAEYGAGPGETHGGGAETVQAGDESASFDGGGEVAQEVGAGLVGFESPVVDFGREFDGFEGVARGDGPAFAAERVVGVGAEPVAYEPADGRCREGFEVDGTVSGPAGESAELLGVVGEFLGSVGDDEQHRQFFGAWREGGEPAQRLRVGPVCVVEDEDERGALDGEMRENPVKAVAQTLRVGRGARLRGAQAECGADDGVPTSEPQTECGVGGAGELRLDELTGDMEGDALFLVAASRGEHGAALCGSAAADLGQEGCLTEARVAGKGEQCAARALGRFRVLRMEADQLAQCFVNSGQFGFALEEPTPVSAGASRHGAPPRPGRASGAARGLPDVRPRGTSEYAREAVRGPALRNAVVRSAPQARQAV